MKSKFGPRQINYLFRLVTLFILFTDLFTGGYSQDIQFTLFNNSPLFINPAATGNFEGNWRITGNYRDQWRALNEPFTTASVSFDKHFYFHGRKVDAGIYLLNDNSGAIGLSANKFYLSLAYAKPFNRNLFRFGLQAGYAFLTFGGENITYPGDWNFTDGVFAGGNPSEKSNYLDINMGAIWQTSIKNLEPELGVSISHLNVPNESFFDATERLPVRFNFHGQMKAKINDDIYILPAFLYMTRKSASMTVLGSNVGFKKFARRSAVKELTAGIYYRDGLFNNADAVSLTGGASIGRIDVAICYDYNISGLKVATSNRGAVEISFAYRSISTVLNSYSIPCERY